MNPLDQIQLASLHYADAREALAGHIAIVQRAMAIIESEKLPAIRKAVARAAEREKHLRDLVAANPGLFDKPKTHIFHGIKVGYAKQPGGIEIEDEDHTVSLIEKKYADDPALLALLIITKKTPSKEGIRDLTVADAKKIGVEILASGNAVVVRPVDGAVEKQVKALLKNAIEEAQ